jgi:hypothetical protein
MADEPDTKTAEPGKAGEPGPPLGQPVYKEANAADNPIDPETGETSIGQQKADERKAADEKAAQEREAKEKEARDKAEQAKQGQQSQQQASNDGSE